MALEVITNKSLSSPVAVGNAKITYPFSFTRDYKVIEQEFIVNASNYIPPSINSSFSIYPKAKLVETSETSIELSGVFRYSNKYLEVPLEAVYLPTTYNYTFPAIYNNTLTDREADETPKGTNPSWSVRREPYTATVPARIKHTFINVAEETYDYSTANTEIQVGDSVSYAGSTWVIISIDKTTQVIEVERSHNIITNGESALGTDTAFLSLYGRIYNNYMNGSWYLINKTKDWTRLQINKAYSIYASYQNFYLDAISNISTGIKVDFVDSNTIPSIYQYGLKVYNKELVQFSESEIEHLGGYIYLRKEVLGHLE